jgi:hypothetical protein
MLQASLLRLAARGALHDASCTSSRCFAAGPGASACLQVAVDVGARAGPSVTPHRLHPPVWLQWLTIERFFGAGKDLTKVARASDVTVSPEEIEAQTITVTPGQAHLGDLRSTSGLGLGDGLLSHTSKWMQVREV